MPEFGQLTKSFTVKNKLIKINFSKTQLNIPEKNLKKRVFFLPALTFMYWIFKQSKQFC